MFLRLYFTQGKSVVNDDSKIIMVIVLTELMEYIAYLSAMSGFKFE